MPKATMDDVLGKLGENRGKLDSLSGELAQMRVDVAGVADSQSKLGERTTALESTFKERTKSLVNESDLRAAIAEHEVKTKKSIAPAKRQRWNGDLIMVIKLLALTMFIAVVIAAGPEAVKAIAGLLGGGI